MRRSVTRALAPTNRVKRGRWSARIPFDRMKQSLLNAGSVSFFEQISRFPQGVSGALIGRLVRAAERVQVDALREGAERLVALASEPFHELIHVITARKLQLADKLLKIKMDLLNARW